MSSLSLKRKSDETLDLQGIPLRKQKTGEHCSSLEAAELTVEAEMAPPVDSIVSFCVHILCLLF
jgi:hypothetical protein